MGLAISVIWAFALLLIAFLVYRSVVKPGRIRDVEDRAEKAEKRLSTMRAGLYEIEDQIQVYTTLYGSSTLTDNITTQIRNTRKELDQQ
jgi:hypothetical protein